MFDGCGGVTAIYPMRDICGKMMCLEMERDEARDFAAKKVEECTRLEKLGLELKKIAEAAIKERDELRAHLHPVNQVDESSNTPA